LDDRRVGRDGAFDLGAVDVLAAGDDHVLQAVDQEEVAPAVQVAGVAGVVPASPQGRGRLVWSVPVALHEVSAPGADFAYLAPVDRLPVGVLDAQLDPG